MSSLCQKQSYILHLVLVFLSCGFFLLYTTTQTFSHPRPKPRPWQNNCTVMCMQGLLQKKKAEVSLCGEKASSRGPGQRWVETRPVRGCSNIKWSLWGRGVRPKYYNLLQFIEGVGLVKYYITTRCGLVMYGVLNEPLLYVKALQFQHYMSFTK